MNSATTNNLAKVKWTYFILPCLLLLLIFCYLAYKHALSKTAYIQVQKEFFLTGNHALSDYPQLMINLTQFGDVVVILSFLAILLALAPKCWECFINAIIVSGIFTMILKPLFAIKRPAAALLHEKFVIIGPKLDGHNSFPSGHSITTFTILSVILFAFMPTRLHHRILWSFCICSIGLVLISTRIGVGAHYPIDVLSGAIFGYLSAIIGILITKKVHLWNWIANIKKYPILIAFLITLCVGMVLKIMDANLLVFYMALISLLVSLFVIAKTYVQQNF